MAYVMLLDLQVVFFFICLIVESFKEVLRRYLAVGYIIIYHTTIIPSVLDKMASSIEPRIVES